MKKYEKLIYRAINKPYLKPYRKEVYNVALLSYVEAKKTYDKTRNVPFIAYLISKLDSDLLTFYRRQKRLEMREISLNTPISSNENETTILEDVLPSNGDFENHLVDRITLKQALAKLTPLQKRVIDLNIHQGFTQKEIAKRLKITQQAVSLIKKKALAILKRAVIDNETN